MNKTRTVFFGSGSFAVPILAALLEMDSVELVGVVTQPDKPAGRKKQLQAVPVKQFLLESEVEVELLQPERFRDDADEILQQLQPALIIVADYGQILPEATLEYPKYKSLNVHASLLPKYRGAVPINMAILNGDDITGITVMKMTAGLDEGPILVQREVAIATSDTAETLERKLAEQGADMLHQVIPSWVAGNIVPREQDHEQATFCGKADLAKQHAQVQLSHGVTQVDRMVRAYYPWPIAWMYVSVRGQQKRLKLFKVAVAEDGAYDKTAGRFVKDGKSLLLNLEQGTLRLEEVQLEGLKRMSGRDYLFLAGEDAYVPK